MKKQSGKKWKQVLIILALVFAGLVGGTGMIFREELKIADSVRAVDGQEKVYYMEVDSDYHFEEFLEAGGASSDGEVSAFLTNCISNGFYQVA